MPIGCWANPFWLNTSWLLNPCWAKPCWLYTGWLNPRLKLRLGWTRLVFCTWVVWVVWVKSKPIFWLFVPLWGLLPWSTTGAEGVDTWAGVESPIKSNRSPLFVLVDVAGFGLFLVGLGGSGFTAWFLDAGFSSFFASCENGFFVLLFYYCYTPVMFGTIKGLFIDGVLSGFLSLSVLYLSRVDLPLV